MIFPFWLTTTDTEPQAKYHAALMIRMVILYEYFLLYMKTVLFYKNVHLTCIIIYLGLFVKSAVVFDFSFEQA